MWRFQTKYETLGQSRNVTQISDLYRMQSIVLAGRGCEFVNFAHNYYIMDILNALSLLLIKAATIVELIHFHKYCR